MNLNRYGWQLRLSLIALTNSMLIAACLSADEQQQVASDPDDICGVVRVSWQLIDAIANDQVGVDVPFNSRFSRGTATGRVEGQVDVTIQPFEPQQRSGDEVTAFIVKAEGSAQGRFVATTGRFRIAGPISIPFSAERAVSFDGRYFKLGEPQVSASVNTRFSTIRSLRRGALGRVTTALATPAIERRRTSAERKASFRARKHVADSMHRHTEKFVSRLNTVTPIEESLFRLYPDMAQWPIHISAHSDYLEAYYAPPGSPPVQLPAAPDKQAAIEIWIRTTTAEAKFFERLGNWKHAQTALAQYFPKQRSDAARLTNDATAQAIGPWFVLLIGSPPTVSLAERD